ncbi:MAG: hypothetical protein R6U57_08350 [Anaerolineales bacterium]
MKSDCEGDYGAMRAKATRDAITFTSLSVDGDVIDTYSLNKRWYSRWPLPGFAFR